jgi:hypothetical protein
MKICNRLNGSRQSSCRSFQKKNKERNVTKTQYITYKKAALRMKHPTLLIPRITPTPQTEREEEDVIKTKNPIQLIREHLTFDSDGKCNNAFKVATHPAVLKLAYETIKSKPGNMVPGSNEETLDGLPTT